ncbi:MAG: GntR family transcriptional regulator [Spirochaetes bacterium]|nr:GntR family transcriptional regulator [Spirochaetota bacterium]MBU1082330.1 GntR family transcriptional regulator [Spirochaetota bacterium]
MTTAGLPLYAVIFNDYKGRILSGELPPGARLPGEMELAAEYGVSRITATRALKELELHKLIVRIRGSGSYVGEGRASPEPDSGVRDGRLSIISLVLPFEAEVSFDIFKGIEDVAKEHDYFVTFHNSSQSETAERQIVEDVISRGSHGLIIYPAMTDNNLDLYSGLMIDTYPFVMIDHKLPGLDTSLVWADNRNGFSEITGHLLELGHRRVVMVGSSVYGISSELERYRGFCKAHIDRGVPLMGKHLYDQHDLARMPADYRPGEEEPRRAIAYLYDLLETIPEPERPTAIAAVNDSLAQLLVTIAMERGIRIPGDYSVTGFDDLPWSAHLPVPLTTVRQDVRTIGRVAAQELFRKINNPGSPARVVDVESRLVVRDSSGEPRKGRAARPERLSAPWEEERVLSSPDAEAPARPGERLGG